VFHGTPFPDGIVQTFESDGLPGRVCLQTVTFAEHAGITVVTQNTVYQSAQDRDKMLRYDNAEDIHESIQRLQELLARLVRLAERTRDIGSGSECRRNTATVGCFTRMPRPAAVAERHGRGSHAAGVTAGSAVATWLACRWALARARKGTVVDLPRRGERQGLPYGGSTRFLWGSTRWRGHRGRFAGGAGTAGRSGRLSSFLPEDGAS